MIGDIRLPACTMIGKCALLDLPMGDIDYAVLDSH